MKCRRSLDRSAPQASLSASKMRFISSPEAEEAQDVAASGSGEFAGRTERIIHLAQTLATISLGHPCQCLLSCCSPPSRFPLQTNPIKGNLQFNTLLLAYLPTYLPRVTCGFSFYPTRRFAGPSNPHCLLGSGSFVFTSHNPCLPTYLPLVTLGFSFTLPTYP